MTVRRSFRRLLTAVAMFMLVSCGGPSDRTVPPAPKDVTSEPITAGVRVSWTASGRGITGFGIDRRTLTVTQGHAGAAIMPLGTQPASTVFEKVGDAPKDASHFDDLTAEPGNTYVYRVVAIGNGGSSPPTQQTNPPVAPLAGVQLRLSIVGTGTVSVGQAGNADERACATTCTLSYAPGAELTLTPKATDGQEFAGWSGACEGVGPCSLTLDEPKAVSAAFGNKVLSVVLQGDTGVTIAISPGASGVGSEVCALEPGQACNVVYQDQVDLDASIQLQKSTAETGSVAEPLQGCESQATGDYVYCTIRVPSGRTVVTATVVHPPRAEDDEYEMLEDGSLVVATPGVVANDEDSPGDVLHALLDASASHGKLDLSENGSFTYNPVLDFAGTDAFTYHARDAYGNTSAAAAATLTVIPVNDAPVFHIDSDPPTVKVGAGVQTIPNFAQDIGPGGGPDETEQVLRFETSWPDDGPLRFSTAPSLALDGTLTYTPQPGTYGKAAVNATLIDDGGTKHGGVDRSSLGFTIKVDPMFLRYSSVGGGSLAADPPPVDGGYDRGTVVTLTASAEPAHRLARWGGACQGVNPAQRTCTLTMAEDLTVSATFESVHTLTVIVSSQYGSASVTSDPSGINRCAGSCTADFGADSTVTLEANSSTYWVVFDHWEGPCDGTRDDVAVCTVTMDADKTITAKFKGSWE